MDYICTCGNELVIDQELTKKCSETIGKKIKVFKPCTVCCKEEKHDYH